MVSVRVTSPSRRALRALSLLATVVVVGACASSTSSSAANMATMPPQPDPRVGLHAGVMDAGQAAWNLTLVSNTQPSDSFKGVTNSDLAFTGKYAIQGNYNGYQVWDISNPAQPVLARGYLCPASQSDVSVYQNLLFVSGEGLGGRLDCGSEGVHDTVSTERLRGLRIFDITDITNPKYIANVQTCRGSHTHTVVTSPNDPDNVYVYISGSAPVRSPSELAGCSGLQPDQDSTTALFRIEVIKVPLAHPEQAAIVSSPRIFNDLAPPPTHPEAAQDVAKAAARAAEARAKGAFTATIRGMEYVLPSRFVDPMLDSVVQARHGTGAPTAADSSALRDALPAMMEARFGARHTGPTQCHDITVYPAIGLAGGACEGYGLLLDIHDPAHPVRLAAVDDSNFSYWHSATFNNDGTKLLFSDEWGGGGQPKCRATDKREWGADAIFARTGDKLTFESYYKLPAPQTEFENCVAHNGSLIPVPGRDIMVQAWYQGGISVFDWTDAAHPKEIAFFDRGPMDSTKLVGAGSWSAYWYNGVIVSSEIARGLDIFALAPSGLLSQNEIDAAKLVHLDHLNVQDQPKFVWPASFVVAGAYLDQLARGNGLAAGKIASLRKGLAKAQEASGAGRHAALALLVTEAQADAAGATDAAKVQTLASAIQDLENAN
ncbi:MAG TPA: hypothetical protein VMG41_04590 [Gemmatimonadales bacterium]|nr:hypothetical protein [Gemmatimonadales bacterium]